MLCPITHNTLLAAIFHLAISFDLVYRYRHKMLCPITNNTLLAAIFCLAISFDLVYRYRHKMLCPITNNTLLAAIFHLAISFDLVYRYRHKMLCPITHNTLLAAIFCPATSFDLVYRYRHKMAWCWPMYKVKNNCQTINSSKEFVMFTIFTTNNEIHNLGTRQQHNLHHPSANFNEVSERSVLYGHNCI